MQQGNAELYQRYIEPHKYVVSCKNASGQWSRFSYYLLELSCDRFSNACSYPISVVASKASFYIWFLDEFTLSFFMGSLYFISSKARTRKVAIRQKNLNVIRCSFYMLLFFPRLLLQTYHWN